MCDGTAAQLPHQLNLNIFLFFISLQLTVNDKSQNLRRLQAQRNELNAKGTSLLANGITFQISYEQFDSRMAPTVHLNTTSALF